MVQERAKERVAPGPVGSPPPEDLGLGNKLNFLAVAVHEQSNITHRNVGLHCGLPVCVAGSATILLALPWWS